MTKRELVELLEQVPDDEEVVMEVCDTAAAFVSIHDVEAFDGRWVLTVVN